MQRRANWAAEAVVSRPLLTALRTCWTDCYSMEDASNPLPALAGSDLLAHDIDLDPEFEDVVNDAVEITDCHDDGSDNEVGGSKTIVDGGWKPGARANNVSGEFCGSPRVAQQPSQSLPESNNLEQKIWTSAMPLLLPVVSFQQSFELCLKKATEEQPILLDEEDEECFEGRRDEGQCNVQTGPSEEDLDSADRANVKGDMESAETVKFNDGIVSADTVNFKDGVDSAEIGNFKNDADSAETVKIKDVTMDSADTALSEIDVGSEDIVQDSLDHFDTEEGGGDNNDPVLAEGAGDSVHSVQDKAGVGPQHAELEHSVDEPELKE